MITTRFSRLIVLAALIFTVLPGVTRAAREGTSPALPSITDIRVSFKLDPRLTQGLYMGDRWVSPPTYSAVREGKEVTVEARAQGLVGKGKPTNIRPDWIPSDPEMVAVTPGQGKEVKITVRRAGQSSLKVASHGYSKELYIKATYEGNAIHVEISRKP
ncbi:MAG: hypothetical protein FD174_2225 [Geobacteraceae bacterium]|nr:MAG: hypothetical protein FD174_2225 [Geobacteraceae bacterium]